MRTQTMVVKRNCEDGVRVVLTPDRLIVTHWHDLCGCLGGEGQVNRG